MKLYCLLSAVCFCTTVGYLAMPFHILPTACVRHHASSSVLHHSSTSFVIPADTVNFLSVQCAKNRKHPIPFLLSTSSKTYLFCHSSLSQVRCCNSICFTQIVKSSFGICLLIRTVVYSYDDGVQMCKIM